MNEELKKQLKEEIKWELKQEIKLEQKRKRKIKIITTFVMVLILIGSLPLIVYIDEQYNENNKFISKEEFSKYITEIPITIENWKEYIELEDTTKENKDGFGNITSINKTTKLKLKGNNTYGYIISKFKIINNNLIWDNERKEGMITIGKTLEDCNSSLPIKNRSSKENTNNIQRTNTTFTIDDIECIQIKGSLYTINLPDDIWQVTDMDVGEGKEYIQVGDKNSYNTYWKNTYINYLSSKERQKYYEQIK